MLTKSQEVNGLPNIKSAMKRVKVTKTKATQNSITRSVLKTSIRKFNEAVASNDESASELLRKAFTAIDRAAAKKVIHKNTAARKKSRLVKAFNAAIANK